MTTTFRERIEGMTAGPWKACPSIEGDFHGVYPDTGRMEFPIAKMPEIIKPEINEANATGIVLSVATARLVASDEAVEMVARAIDPDAFKTKAEWFAVLGPKISDQTFARLQADTSVERFEPHRRLAREAARRVLSAIQAAAMEGA